MHADYVYEENTIDENAPNFFEELRDIPNLIPSIKDTGFYISGSNWFTDLIITPIVFVVSNLRQNAGFVRWVN